MKFPCTGCGECCRRLGEILHGTAKLDHPIMQHLLQTFPYQPNADGSCPMLDGDRCRVYEDRPALCNLETIQEMLQVPDEVWLQLNGASCNQLIREAGLGVEWFVRTTT